MKKGFRKICSLMLTLMLVLSTITPSVMAADVEVLNEVNSFVCINEDGSSVSTVNYGDKLSAKVEGSLEADCENKLIVTTHSGDDLKKVFINDITFSDDNGPEYSEEIEVLDYVPYGIDTVKCFLWNDMESLIPLADPITVSVTAIEDNSVWSFSNAADVVRTNSRASDYTIEDGGLTVKYAGVTKNSAASITLKTVEISEGAYIKVKAILPAGTQLRLYDTANSSNYGVHTVSDEQAGQWTTYMFPAANAGEGAESIATNAVLRLDILGTTTEEVSGTALFENVDTFVRNNWSFDFADDVEKVNSRVTSHTISNGILTAEFAGAKNSSAASITLKSMEIPENAVITVRAKMPAGTQLRLFDNTTGATANHGTCVVSEAQAGQWATYTFPTEDATDTTIATNATLRLDILGTTSAEISGTAQFDSVDIEVVEVVVPNGWVFDDASDVEKKNSRITSYTVENGILTANYANTTNSSAASITLKAMEIGNNATISVRANMPAGTKLRIYDTANSANYGSHTVSEEQAGQWATYTFPAADATATTIATNAVFRLDILGTTSSKISGVALFDAVNIDIKDGWYFNDASDVAKLNSRMTNPVYEDGILAVHFTGTIGLSASSMTLTNLVLNEDDTVEIKAKLPAGTKLRIWDATNSVNYGYYLVSEEQAGQWATYVFPANSDETTATTLAPDATLRVDILSVDENVTEGDAWFDYVAIK